LKHLNPRLVDRSKEQNNWWRRIVVLPRVRFIGSASGAGAQVPGSEAGPDNLRAAGIVRRLAAMGVDANWERTVYPVADPDPFKTVAGLAVRVGAQVEAVLARGAFPVVVGGDHCCALGTWSAVSRVAGGAGLVWIDAHLDSHTPQTSHTGAIHGMPLASLLGYGNPELVRVMPKPLDPAHVCVVGARSFEPEEAALLMRLGVRVFSGVEVARRGLGEVMEEALFVAGAAPGGFGVSLDLDVLDPGDAPGTGTPEPDGLALRDLAAALRRIGADPRLLAVEIAEFNPLLDVGNQTLAAMESLLQAALATGRPDTASLIETEREFGAHIYASLPLVLTRGAGSRVWDTEGRRYIDMLGAYSAQAFGHCHPRLTRVLTVQARRLALTSRAAYNDRLPELLRRLARITGLDRALPLNTGLEAVEAALKAARKWAYKVKGVAPDRAHVLACEGNFHGRSIAIVGLSTVAQYRDGFGPFPPGLETVPFGDAGALQSAIRPETAAFLVEPIQGEGGIRVPPPGYLAQCADLCRRNAVLFIADEVQTGLGRTGRMFAVEHEGVRPDAIIVGKALGGGLLPVSALVGTSALMDVLRPGDHGSTFGGNPLGAAVALEALALIEEEHLPERAARLGSRFLAALRAIAHPAILEVRGRGLLIGMALDPLRLDAADLVARLLARGILTRETHGNVVRFAPPLTVDETTLDEAVAAIRAALDDCLGRRAA
jgi:ornithine--oxo-acid transaminase